MEKELVSIIIPVYNGSNYLAEAIESAVKQTYREIEILVVNDGSTDDGATRRIVEGFKEVKYFEKTNGGVASALNFGIERMRGKFFSWLSHDDRYYPDKIAKQVEFYHALNVENAIIYSHEDQIDGEGRIIKKARPFKESTEPLLYTLLYKRFIGGCSLLIPSHAFTNIGRFNESLKTVQDYDLWYRLIGGGYEFHYCPISSDQIRRHESQDSKTKKTSHKDEKAKLFLHVINSLPRNLWIEGMKNKYYALAKLSFRYRLQGQLAASEKASSLIADYANTRIPYIRKILFSLCYGLSALNWVLVKVYNKLKSGIKSVLN